MTVAANPPSESDTNRTPKLANCKVQVNIRTVSSLEFDEFEEAMLGLDGRYLLVGRSQLHWSINVLALAGLAAMDSRNGASSLYRGACLPGQYGLFVPISQFDRLRFNGHVLGQDAVSWTLPSAEFSVPSTVGMSWFGVVVDEPIVRSWIDAGLLDHRATEPHSGYAGSASVQRLATLIPRALRVAANAAVDLEPLTARESLRHQLLDATLDVVRSMRPDQESHKGRPRIDRTEVLKRALDFVEECLDQPIQVADLCKRAGVSVATMQNIFAEQFGISPHRYLMLRRLHAIHRAMRHAEPQDTVSTLCARYGVWDFGRFASQYRKYFGIAPSKALELRQREH